MKAFIIASALALIVSADAEAQNTKKTNAFGNNNTEMSADTPVTRTVRHPQNRQGKSTRDLRAGSKTRRPANVYDPNRRVTSADTTQVRMHMGQNVSRDPNSMRAEPGVRIHQEDALDPSDTTGH